MAKTVTYLEHNRDRMNYPEYRRAGVARNHSLDGIAGEGDELPCEGDRDVLE